MIGITEIEQIRYNNKYSSHDRPIAGEFISQEFGTSNSDYCVISRNGDIVDNIYLCLITSEFISDPYKLIENVQLISQGDVLEEFSGDSMYISSVINKSQVITNCFRDENKIYLKLNFALKEIPLIRNQFHEIKVYIKLNKIYEKLVISKYLNINYLFLDNIDRKELAQKEICEYQVSSIQETKFNFKKGEQIKLDIPKGLLRELIIYVKRKQECRDVSLTVLSNIKLLIFGQVKEYVDLMYYRDITSHQYYNCETPDNMYIIPIDNTPLEKYPSATLNTHEAFSSILLDIKENINIEEYEIILFSRKCEIITSAYGIIKKIKIKHEMQEIKQEKSLLNYITFGYF